MNALTLAEYLDRHVHIAAMHDECANKLRRQHEAIVKLRKALEEIQQWTDRWTRPGHPVSTFAGKALKDTEDLK